MGLPFFYIESYSTADENISLNEDTSKHVAQVLRMREGELLLLTDGKGSTIKAAITDANRKKCVVKVISRTLQQRTAAGKIIAISPLKNSTRFEWFLEKATEIGITRFIPLLCARTEKQYLKLERIRSILISAMLQSQQSWLPDFEPAIKFPAFIENYNQPANKFIAHCEDEAGKVFLPQRTADKILDTIVLIGPEGDFTKVEIDMAANNSFMPVTFGETRLRTETAGLVAATLICAY